MLKHTGVLLTIVFVLTIHSPLLEAGKSSGNLLERFFKNVHTYQAEFRQVVLDAEGNEIQQSSGSLWISRPGKFRWDYKTPFTQIIVGDSKKVWIYDPELKQVTVKEYEGNISQTPALLLASNKKLTDNFVISKLGTKDKITWLGLKTKGRQENFSDIHIGFVNKKLSILELIDSFGQTTRITLKQPKENLMIKSNIFSFTPPKGVDVVGEK